MISKPCVRRLVMRMGRIENRDQHVYIQQCRAQLVLVPNAIDFFKRHGKRPRLSAKNTDAISVLRSVLRL